jgi:hypothetical protein
VIPGARVRLDKPVLSAKEWQGGYNVRGIEGEGRAILQRYPGSQRLPPGFETFDTVQGGQSRPAPSTVKKGVTRSAEIIEGGKAISVKTVDLSEKGYATADGTVKNLKGYVTDIAEYPKEGLSRVGKHPITGQPHEVTVVNPSERVLHIELSAVPTQEQMAGLSRIRFEAAEKGIEVVIVAPNQ